LLGGDAIWSPWSPSNAASHRVQPQKQASAMHGASPPFVAEDSANEDDAIVADNEKPRVRAGQQDERPGTASKAWMSPRGKDARSREADDAQAVRPLFVSIMSAKNLRNDRGMPANDPFCVCRLGGQEFRTRSRRDTTDTLNPVWECEVTLKDYSWGENIEFVVYDDLSSIGGSKEMLCSTTLAADQFCSQKDGARSAKFQGELRLLRPRTNFAAGSSMNVAVSLEAAAPPLGHAIGMEEVPCSTEEERATWRFRGLRTLSAAAARMVVEPTQTSPAHKKTHVSSGTAASDLLALRQ